MKRWLIWSFIGTYLAAMGWGIVSHATYYRVSAHPLMYFVVWDMFCGWSAYNTRMQIVGEGESGKHYRLAPGPWGEYRPYGQLARHHYDTTGMNSARLALNTLRHTRHEPMARIFVVEEAWAKKFNLPDHIWKRRYDEPKDVQKYYQVRSIHDGQGNPQQFFTNWLDQQAYLAVATSPKITAEYSRSRNYYQPKVAHRISLGQLSAFEAAGGTAAGSVPEQAAEPGRAVAAPLGP